MADVMKVLPEITGEEQIFIKMLLEDMTDEQAESFAASYRSQRKDPSNILLFTLIGFAGVAGIQRFMLDQMGMGVLYLLTGGICGVGTIIDLVNHKKLALEYNQQRAQQIASMVKSSS